MRRAWNASTMVVLGLGVLAFVARLVPVLRGGGLHGVLAYDDGVYFGAAEAFVFGRLPYRDFLLLHPPGIVLVLSPFALLARLTNDDDTGFALARLAFMGIGAVNATLVYRVARARLGVVAGVAGGLFYAVWAPAVYAERTTMLEPLVNLGVLTSLLLIGDPRTASRRRLLAAGAALGLATAVKLWAGVPLVVLLCWVLLRRRRAALAYALGAAAAATAVCLPFFVLAPGTMFRLVVLDQLGRTNNAVPATERLAGITDATYLGRLTPSHIATLAALLSAVTLVAVAVLVYRSPRARPWCALLVAQSALLLAAPSYFSHYATYVAPALALVVGATAALGLGVLRSWAGWLAPVALTTGVLAAGALLATTELRVEGLPSPESAALAVQPAAGCAAADTPAMLETADLLVHDLRHHCVVLVDPTGLTYDQDPGDLRTGSTVAARRADAEWQRRIQRWLDGSQLAILQHRNPDGLSRQTLRTLARADTLTRRPDYDVYVAPAHPPS